MKKEKKYEGKTYKFKRNSMKKMKQKYNPTYHYIIENILKYKKNKKEFLKVTKINEENEEEFQKLLIKIVESTAKDFHLDNNRIYSYNKFNRVLIKKLNKELKQERKNKIEIKLKVVKLYKMIDKKEYKDLRKIAIEKPNDFLKALYLYTICED